jgi:hypothetical protein
MYQISTTHAIGELQQASYNLRKATCEPGRQDYSARELEHDLNKLCSIKREFKVGSRLSSRKRSHYLIKIFTRFSLYRFKKSDVAGGVVYLYTNGEDELKCFFSRITRTSFTGPEERPREDGLMSRSRESKIRWSSGVGSSVVDLSNDDQVSSCFAICATREELILCATNPATVKHFDRAGEETEHKRRHV